MEISNKKAFSTLNPNKIWIPVLIGLAISVWLFLSDDHVSVENLQVLLQPLSVFSLVLAVIVILFRDAGYIYRIRTLTGKSLSWTSSFYVIILWEFSSAVTPSVVGGSAVAVFILMKEGLSFGRALAYVMLTAILDNLFFVVFAPLVIVLAHGSIFDGITTDALGKSLPVIFWTSYSLIAIYTLVMSFALLVHPRGFKWLLLKITSWGFLRRYRARANKQGDEMILGAKELIGKPATYWFKVVLATVFVWVARYLMLNAVMGGYVLLSIKEHLFIFGRQLIMWIVMLISPTPGSSGTAEYFYGLFFQHFLGEFTFGTSLLWRLLAYYPYLFLGAVFLPRWIQKVFFDRKKGNQK
ncbi:lysylphosphatidylglycerol synthase transmembrane domain-containing protein [Persicobacter psychrovividus]|uniref:Flippase-like domain-containing protein n=1 Tax=Persicobacter psychrovividus TaxID=387638 RepID=A0ABM7VEV5_9BACT|nr:hypothetical protein PEPS_16720 [Persicobacter psychrovividus]